MLDDTGWIACASRLPERGVVVETAIIENGSERDVQPLKRGNAGALWFTPDAVMYVYYTPTHWRQMSNTATGLPNACPHGVVHGPGLLACVICFPPTPVGWQCPVCKTVNAPHALECRRCSPYGR